MATPKLELILKESFAFKILKCPKTLYAVI